MVGGRGLGRADIEGGKSIHSPPNEQINRAVKVPFLMELSYYIKPLSSNKVSF